MLPAGETRQIEDATARGYQLLGRFDSTDGQGEQVLLYKAVDQLRQCLDTIIKDPGNRRILFHGWNWAQLEEMALPPCHLLYQFLVNQAKGEISLCLLHPQQRRGPGHALQPHRRRRAADPDGPPHRLQAALVHLLHRRRAHLPKTTWTCSQEQLEARALPRAQAGLVRPASPTTP